MGPTSQPVRTLWSLREQQAAERLVRLALTEDRAAADPTSRLAVPAAAAGRATLVCRAAGVVAGLPLLRLVYRIFDRRVRVRCLCADGARVSAGDVIATCAGPARALLACERTALNFLQRLSGIATLTARFVQAVAGTGVAIVDTRKTAPGWRLLEKYAVRCGGGVNHRLHLADMIMLKDNHLALSPLTLPELIAAARARYPRLPVACEAETLAQVAQLLPTGVDVLMLDNMSPRALRAAAALCRGRACLEATGGVTLKNVRAVARTGVARISVGALTHSAPALNLSLEIA